MTLIGVVVQLKRPSGVVGMLHYLYLPHMQPNMLKDGWVYLKKHVDHKQLGSVGLRAWKNVMGHNIAHVEGGYYCVKMFVPTSLTAPDDRLFDKDIYRLLACEVANRVVVQFQKQLRTASSQDKAYLAKAGELQNQHLPYFKERSSLHPEPSGPSPRHHW